MSTAGAVRPAAGAFRCESALVAGRVMREVTIRHAGGVITGIDTVGPGAVAAADDVQPVLVPGLVVPGFADAHSHVFHRGLRGRTHNDGGGGGTFWTWREQMYAQAQQHTPDTLYALAVAAYTELLCAGYTAVGEFHYLHHQPDGSRYDDPNAMGIALAEAAREVDIAFTLLDTCYLAGGFDQPLGPRQLRFSDGSAGAWAQRVAALPSWIGRGAAVHSVRAVPADALPTIAQAAAGGPLHVHLSEQPAENEACRAVTGCTPTELLDRFGVLGERTSAVHATHLTDGDITVLGERGVTAVICPTTEADLADGLPDIAAMRAAGIALACGGDQQVIVDPFAQARGIEYGERLRTGRRGTLDPGRLMVAATENSHRSIGSSAGRIAIGAPADLVAIRTDSPRTAGSAPEQLVMTATAADVALVVRGGRVVARDGIHQRLGDPGPLLARALTAPPS